MEPFMNEVSKNLDYFHPPPPPYLHSEMIYREKSTQTTLLVYLPSGTPYTLTVQTSDVKWSLFLT